MKLFKIQYLICLLVLSSCSTVYKNGYKQSRKYKPGKILAHNKKKQTTRHKIVYKEKNNEKVNSEIIAEKDPIKSKQTKAKNPLPKLHAQYQANSSYNLIRKTIHKPVKMSTDKKNTDSQNLNKFNENDEDLEKETPWMSVASIVLIVLSTLLAVVFVNGTLLVLLWISVLQISGIVLGFMGAKEYKENPDKYKGKVWVIIAQVLAWVYTILNIISILYLLFILLLLFR